MNSPTEQLVIIRTVDELKQLEHYLADKDFIAYDTESTGVDEDSEIIGFSVCADINVGYYCITAYWDVGAQKLIYLETHEYAKQFIKCLEGKRLIMQNAPHDCRITKYNYGTELMPYVHTDTLPLGHLLNENRSNGLKERGVELYGEDAKAEQKAMQESVAKNGGVLTKERYELYKADADLIAYYGAKDAVLTLNIFYHDVPLLFEAGLDKFFYEDETMPLLRGPTYDLNTRGLRVDPQKLQELKSFLEAECVEAKAFITQEIAPNIAAKYPGASKKTMFNVDSSQQRAWLLFEILGNEFVGLTKGGKELCDALDLRMPYSFADKRRFVHAVKDAKGRTYHSNDGGKAKKVKDFWCYVTCGKETVAKFQDKYKWVRRYGEYAKNKKLLSTYVEGIQSRMKYNVIKPGFLQSGTTSGRYSSRGPNFQNLPRDDKRVKSCIVARAGCVLVGADYEQLEPRVFASQSGDAALINCFSDGDDFYSVVGVDTFNKEVSSLKKDAPGSFSVLFPALRNIAKVIALKIPYGATAFDLGRQMGKDREEGQYIIDNYLSKYPGVKKMMLEAYEQVKTEGFTCNLFGRPRRIPEAMKIPKIYGRTKHADLPYEQRNMLNLAVNHKIQSTGASIINRAAIAFHARVREAGLKDCYIVMQVHDELIAECLEKDAATVADIMKDCMENTTKLPKVALIAKPKIARDLGALK